MGALLISNFLKMKTKACLNIIEICFSLYSSWTDCVCLIYGAIELPKREWYTKKLRLTKCMQEYMNVPEKTNHQNFRKIQRKLSFPQKRKIEP
jgi:hypothetical protein